jgi:HEAT repeat protein
MAISAKCPTCEHSYNVPDSQRGKRVKCRNCADLFLVGGGGRDRDDDRDSDRGRDRDRDDDRRETTRERRDDRDDRRRDDRDDRRDRDDKPRKKKAQDDPGSMMPLVLIVGGVFLLILIGGGVAVFWVLSRPPAKPLDNALAQLEEELRKQGGNPGINPGINFNPGGGGNPAPRSVFTEPKNLDEALQDLREQGTDGFMRDARSNWIAKQQPQPNRRKEVCDLLWKLAQDPGHGQGAAQNAFCKWAGPEQGDQVVELLDKRNDVAMEAAARLKLAKAAPGLCKRFIDGWPNRQGIAKHLETLGAALAEKEVVKLVNHQDGEVRTIAGNLLKTWGTKPSVIVAQMLVDAQGGKDDVARTALDALAKLPVDAATQADVNKALKTLLAGTNQEHIRLALLVAGVWGTAAITPELIVLIEKGRGDAYETAGKLKLAETAPALCQRLPVDPGQRRNLLTQIEALGQQAAEKELVKLVNTPDNNLRNDITNLLKKWGGGKSGAILDQILVDLNSGKDEVCRAALTTLAATPVDAAKQGDVVKALKKLLLSPTDFIAHGAVLAAVTWATADIEQELAALVTSPASRVDRNKAMEALVKINTDATREFVATQIVNPGLRNAASTLIQKTGAVFEPQVLKVLKLIPLTDGNSRREAIKILGAIGTAASLPTLQALLQDKDKSVAGQAKLAELAIATRPKP